MRLKSKAAYAALRKRATKRSGASPSKVATPRLEARKAPKARLRGKPSKYHNVRITVDGHNFASKREAKRYGELKLLQKAGLISNLRLQTRFPLKIWGELICTYVADFDYVDPPDLFVVEDSKGARTDVYRIKKRLMKVIHGIEVQEV